MKILHILTGLMGSLLLLVQPVLAQESWPKTLTASNGSVIKVFEWQPESFSDNVLKAKAAISVQESGQDPVFGMAWLTANTSTNGNEVQVNSIRVNDIKLPGKMESQQLDNVQALLEDQLTRQSISFPVSGLQSSLNLDKQEDALSNQISHTPPKIIYTTAPSILVVIDGNPKLQRNNDWGVDVVVNTPFTIVKQSNGNYYLHGGKHWYMASGATGPYKLTTNVPSNLKPVEQALRDAGKNDEQGKETDENTIYNIIVSTTPAELVQSNGDAKFSPVQGTNLLYVSNSDDDIFMDIDAQQYYVLISGRWYRSSTLRGNWQYISSESLPKDFANIQPGSPKDNVLASVAGTPAASDAVREAEVPQTAKVDRKKTTANINYDGDPEFEHIDGTEMDYATNTNASVIRWRDRYYAVDNGIWFEAYSAMGPWTVAVVRPYPVALIPPRYPVYHIKYVYIYDVYPDYVYMGYTPGYLNTFICGPTVVYGTGFYYQPWYRRYYYPRPWTWGFCARYNPWFGWGMGINLSVGWFHVGIGTGHYPWGYWSGGWWGPRVYRMPYCYAPSYYYGPRYYGGYYSRGYYSGYHANYGYVARSNNIYNNRRNVITRDNQRYAWAGNRANYGNRNPYSNPGGRPNRNYEGGRWNGGRNDGGRVGRTDGRDFNRGDRDFNRGGRISNGDRNNDGRFNNGGNRDNNGGRINDGRFNNGGNRDNNGGRINNGDRGGDRNNNGGRVGSGNRFNNVGRDNDGNAIINNDDRFNNGNRPGNEGRLGNIPRSVDRNDRTDYPQNRAREIQRPDRFGGSNNGAVNREPAYRNSSPRTIDRGNGNMSRPSYGDRGGRFEGSRMSSPGGGRSEGPRMSSPGGGGGGNRSSHSGGGRPASSGGGSGGSRGARGR